MKILILDNFGVYEMRQFGWKNIEKIVNCETKSFAKYYEIKMKKLDASLSQSFKITFS